MTQEQVDTGYGIYGPRTKAAYASAQKSGKSTSSSNTSSSSTSSPNL